MQPFSPALTRLRHCVRSLERSRNPGDLAPFPREYLHPIQPAVLHGEATFVPARPVALLTHHHGYIGPDSVRDPITRYFRPRNASSSLSGFALHAAKQTADAVWLES